MSDRFRPIAAGQLFEWVFRELESRDSIFGIPRRHIFVPAENDPFRTSAFRHSLETPFGPAAGPHSQMAQNIVAAWLCGARYIELKTVQTIDELDVSKPCIDMEDEGYNVEWSQELKVHESFDEYLRAWVLIHALHHRLGFPGEAPGILFNLSVGYDLAGIQQANVQWFLDQARDCSAYKTDMIDRIARYYPAVREVPVPDQLSDNVTLSTMHGCPPDEIGKICEYLMKERGLHTYVKCNPTLLGPEKVRRILNEDLGFIDVTVPDQAFGHDLAWHDAIPLLRGLRASACECGLDFGVKLTNTLEVENWRSIFDASEKMMYLSGRPLHAITVNLAADLAGEFDGRLPMSFSAGADCFNAPQLLGCGMQTVTACSDLLKTGGYLRLLQYLENTREAIHAAGASGLQEFILETGGNDDPGADTSSAALENLRRYASRVSRDRLLRKDTFLTTRSKTNRELGLFDCIEAPCTDACAIDQMVPRYMGAVRQGDFEEAVRLTRADNPIPVLLGRTCDHLCEPVCIRTHLDEPLAIRHIKRFIMEQENKAPSFSRPSAPGKRVAIIGAGPGGLAAASELGRAGVAVEIFEKHAYAGGMVGGAIPEYRLPHGTIDQDLAVLDSLGVKIHYNTAAGKNFTLTELRARGFDSVVIAVGAQLGKKLGLEGEECEGVVDALHFLRKSREGDPPDIGPHIGIIGAGDTAMDCARTAWRRFGGGVSIIYRRSLQQMPADREEIRCLLEEGIAVTGMAKPQRLLVVDGKLRGLVCRRTEYRGDRDASGRKVPHEIPGDEFEVPLDTLILAVSQHAILDFFDAEPVAVNSRGYIKADPATFETSVPGVYAGGDVVNEGPSSIVEAAADGKAIARSILGQSANEEAMVGIEPFDPATLMRKRALREWRVPVPHTPPAKRKNFEEVVLGYAERQARSEAARCLDCDVYCSICVGVCPNLALLTFSTEPFEAILPALQYKNGNIQVTGGATFGISQAFQVAVLADFCNECGNCTTFCPTSGEPYRAKPRLYLDREEFGLQADNAFMVTREAGLWTMEARFGGETHRAELNSHLYYTGPAFRARIDPRSFSVEHIEATPGGSGTGPVSLQSCATMYMLLKGLRDSMPHFPVAQPPDRASEGRITHPEYEEYTR
jgi:putative selenate reductase